MNEPAGPGSVAIQRESAFFGFLWLALAPLIDQGLHFVEDVPALADQPVRRLQRLELGPLPRGRTTRTRSPGG